MLCKKSLWLFLGVFAFFNLSAQKTTTLFETSKGTQTPTYFEIVDWWKKIDGLSARITMKTMGMTDAGYPLHLVTISRQPVKDFAAARKAGKTIILINNGIHAGEPDGIDASILLARDIAENRFALPDNIVLAIIPVYNIGGCLNRSAFYRIDQDGPEAFGSRGNSQNLDLNRDFIKCDTKDAFAFAEIFHAVDPDIFLDNHVSNGADYQHVITLLSSQHNKMEKSMGAFMHDVFEPAIFSLMKKDGYNLIPYVNHFGKKVDEGWTAFWDSPRYASGYASLFQTFAFVPETHMLKPYQQRVEATYALMKAFIKFAQQNGIMITGLRKKAREQIMAQNLFPTGFKIDSSQVSYFEFNGYKGITKNSEVSGLPRLYYDRSQPYTKTIPFYNHYSPTRFIQKPRAYIIPQGWWRVTDRLKANGVRMSRLTKDSLMDVESYYISSYRSSAVPYQMHHANTNVEIEKKKEKRMYAKGDWLIFMDQPANHFLVETLEPDGEDSYFTWNFFDGVLNAKEWYSDYNYEDTAATYLKNNPALREELERKKKADPAFANSAEAQLTYLFNASPYKDPDYRKYPVARIP